jgi:antitoxin component YwqK of YwqJK toxin-antitoxin module
MSLAPPNPKTRRKKSVRVPFFTVLVAVGLLGMLFRLNSSSDGPETCTPHQLVLRDGLLCRTNTGAPFTGHLVETYPDGSLKSRATLYGGLLEGLSEGWQTNGVLQITETFHENLSDGVRTKWCLSGAKLSESTLVQGKMQGVFHGWHENGQLAEEIMLKDDQPIGEARAWYPSGFLKAVIGTNSSGQREHKTWGDGECRVWPPKANQSP